VRSDVLRIAVSLVFILGGAVGMAATIIPEIDSGPLNTTYFIEGQPILLKQANRKGQRRRVLPPEPDRRSVASLSTESLIPIVTPPCSLPSIGITRVLEIIDGKLDFVDPARALRVLQGNAGQ